MKREHLDEMITKKADENVQVAICKFRNAVDAAVMELVGLSRSGWKDREFGKWGVYLNHKDSRDSSSELAEAAAQCLTKAVATDGGNTGWPKVLWEQERQKIESDILSKMDTLQRLLHVKGPGPNDVTPDKSVPSD